MSPHDRRAWLYARAKEEKCGLDVLHAELVLDYITATDSPFYPQMWGAHKCPQLGRDLSAMRKSGALKRHRSGLAGSWQPGFPTWVWSYQIDDAYSHIWDAIYLPTREEAA